MTFLEQDTTVGAPHTTPSERRCGKDGSFLSYHPHTALPAPFLLFPMASPGPTKRAMTSSNRYSLSPGPASSGGAPVLAFDDDKIRVACRVRPPAERDACSGVKGDTSSKVADGVLDQKYMDDAVRNKTRLETRGVWDAALSSHFFR